MTEESFAFGTLKGSPELWTKSHPSELMSYISTPCQKWKMDVAQILNHQRLRYVKP